MRALTISTIGILLLLFTYSVEAQVGKLVVKKKGYVVTNAGDTVKGYLRIETDYENQYKIAVYDAARKGKKRHFTPHTAKGFAYYQLVEKKWVSYDSRQMTRLKLSRIFMKRIRTGKVILYSVLHNADPHKGYNYFESFCLAKNDSSEFLVVNKLNFKKPMRKFFKEDLDLVVSMGKRGYRYENVPQMVDRYNDEGGARYSQIK